MAVKVSTIDQLLELGDVVKSANVRSPGRKTPTNERPTKEDDIRRYYVYFANGDERYIKVPATCKVTFGPLTPQNSAYANESAGFCLRFYEAKDKQRACIPGIRSFYDTTLTITEALEVNEYTGMFEEEGVTDEEF